MWIGQSDMPVRNDGNERIEPKFVRRNEEHELKRSVCPRVWWWCWKIVVKKIIDFVENFIKEIGKECPLP